MTHSVSADRAPEPAHLSAIIRDGSSVGHQTKGNNLRCHGPPSTREGKGRREYAYTPERPCAVFLLGRTHHRNGDCRCEPAHLNVVLGWMLPQRTERRDPATVAQWRGFFAVDTRASFFGRACPPETPSRLAGVRNPSWDPS